MPLIIGRRVGEKIRLVIDPSADPQEALRAMLEEGIEIEVTCIKSLNHVRFGILAPKNVLVLREEVIPDRHDHSAQ